jgi:hypothetical protein
MLKIGDKKKVRKDVKIGKVATKQFQVNINLV